MVRVWSDRALLIGRALRTEGWVGRFLTTNLFTVGTLLFPFAPLFKFFFFLFFFGLTYIHQSCCGIDGIE